jgi:hypothetical protein
MGEAERKNYVKIVQAKIKAGREQPIDGLSDAVNMIDEAQKPATVIRRKTEADMERWVKQLPVYAWAEAIPGFGAIGLATIIAETGPLDRYPNVGKLWKRLGYAPYDGHAGSTWRRPKWRPRNLSDEEWTKLGFSPERYGFMYMIAESLFRKQWIGKNKTDDGVGRPNGHYGEVYGARRKFTAEHRSYWTPEHQKRDALRVMMKALLCDLWVAWHAAEGIKCPTSKFAPDHVLPETQEGCVGSKGVTAQVSPETQQGDDGCHAAYSISSQHEPQAPAVGNGAMAPRRVEIHGNGRHRATNSPTLVNTETSSSSNAGGGVAAQRRAANSNPGTDKASSVAGGGAAAHETYEAQSICGRRATKSSDEHKEENRDHDLSG